MPHFFDQAAVRNMAELEIGRMAAEKASNEEVKAFAERILHDHGKAQDQLMKIAQDEGLKVPKSIDQHHKKMRDMLSGLSGDAFDQQFIDGEISEHQKTVALFEEEAKSGSGSLKHFAEKTLPSLKSHLKKAKEISSHLKMSH